MANAGSNSSWRLTESSSHTAGHKSSLAGCMLEKTKELQTVGYKCRMLEVVSTLKSGTNGSEKTEK